MSPGDNLHFPSRHFAIPALSIPALCHPGTFHPGTLPSRHFTNPANCCSARKYCFFFNFTKMCTKLQFLYKLIQPKRKKKNLVDDTKLHIYLFQGLNVMENKYQKFHFPLGFLDFFMLIPSLANARDGKKHEKVSKPHGKMKFPDIYFPSLTNPWKWYINNYYFIFSKIINLVNPLFIVTVEGRLFWEITTVVLSVKTCPPSTRVHILWI